MADNFDEVVPDALDAIEERPFPVVESMSLPPAERRRFRRPVRRDVPAQRPGTVLVAQLNHAYRIVPQRARPTDPVLVDATSLLLVSTRRQLVPAAAVLPSADPRTGLEIRARFACQVVDPVLVLQAGGWDIRPFLVDHLLSYPRVRMLCLAQAGLGGWPQFQQRLVAMLLAYGEVSPIQVPGVTTAMADVAVAPRPLLQQVASLDPSLDASLDGTTDPAWSGGLGPDAPRDRDPAFRPGNYTWESNE